MRLLYIADFTEQFPYRVLRGILRYAKEKGENWTVRRMPVGYKEEHGLRFVARYAKFWKIDAVIGLFTKRDNLKHFRKAGIAVMAQEYITRIPGVPNIQAENRKAGAMVAERLVARGFRNFAFVGHKGVFWSEERWEGFRDYLVKAGFGDRVHLYETVTDLWSYDQNLIQEWLDSLEYPFGIMACDDTVGSLLLEICGVAGIRVPFDVSIIGVDNDETTCSLTLPPLSSVEMDIEKGGYEAASMLDRMTGDETYPGEDIIIQPSAIITRESSNAIATHDVEVHKALTYIHLHADHKISVPDVLKVVALSRRLLEQRFLKVTGTSIYRYISEVRMNRFAQLLLSENASVEELAARLDEPDVRSLSRRFKEIRGCTPTYYRKRNMRKL